NQQGFNPFTNYNPSLGFYDGSASSTISTQIAAMRYAGMNAGIASWWGQGSKTDQRIPLLLQAAAGTTFRWSLYYEPEGSSDPTTFTTNVQAMAASKAPWQLVTTFNEWGEGTSVESAQEWASSSGYGTYNDILHQYLSGSTPSTTTTSTSTPPTTAASTTTT